MTNQKKAIKGLECCDLDGTCHNEQCPYSRDLYCHELLKAGLLSLLKEQEPILLENQHKPYGHSTNANSPWISRCPKCGKKIEGRQTRFCKYCGQAVKWNDLPGKCD